MIEHDLKTKIKSLPPTPGIYIYKDAKGAVLYVGKAKSLRSRVRSYFTQSAALGPLKEKLMTLISDLETISTDTELEALVLEATLIHKHQPPYNVLLRDDKYYLFIKITKEEPPRIFPVRKITRDGSRYFGPYSSSFSVRATLRLLQRIFPFKGEKDTAHDIIFPHVLFRQKSSAPFSPIGEKVPPPTGGADEGNPQRDDSPHPLPLPQLGEENSASITNVIRFLKGHRSEIIKTLEAGIAEASKNLQFERAALFRDQLQAVQRLEGSQKVYLPRKESFDVISIAESGNQSAANVLQIREGKLIGKQTFLLKHKKEGTSADILRQFLLQYYAVAQDVAKNILIPFQLEDTSVLEQWIKNVSIVVPERGVRKALIAMGETNAKEFLKEQGAAQETARASKEALGVLLKAINIQPPAAKAMGDHPFRVEVYDISNIQGTLATASMIVFVDGMPEKKEYRKFKIKLNADADPTMHKSNDFAMLEETLTRRLSRNDWQTPDLLIIDGGKGQLSSTMKAVRLASLAHGKPFIDIPIISIAKQEEEIFLPGKTESIRLPYDSPALYLIQRMRDEAHRFTITYHRSLRSKEHIKSALDEVPGIGPKTKKLLIKTFGSVKGIKSASDEELEKVIGVKKTKVLREHL